MKTQSNNSNFETHIEKIKKSRQQTKKILEAIMPCFDSAEAAISLLWESVFDYLVIHENEHSLTEINTLSGILQKLMSSYNQFKALEIKTQEHQMKKEEFDIRINELKNNIFPSIKEGGFLPKEILHEVEHQLNLL